MAQIAPFLVFMAKTVNDRCTTIEYRVKLLEKNYEEIDKKMEMILENHLPHLNQSMESLKTRVQVSMAINVGALVLVAVFIYFLQK